MDSVFSVRDLRPEIVMLRMSLVRLLADPAARSSVLAGAARALASVLRTQARLAASGQGPDTPRHPEPNNEQTGGPTVAAPSPSRPAKRACNCHRNNSGQICPASRKQRQQ
jgi:hypothetical protein